METWSDAATPPVLPSTALFARNWVGEKLLDWATVGVSVGLAAAVLGLDMVKIWTSESSTPPFTLSVCSAEMTLILEVGAGEGRRVALVGDLDGDWEGGFVGDWVGVLDGDLEGD